MLLLEVLIRKFLAVDRLAASALDTLVSASLDEPLSTVRRPGLAYVATGEVASLKHELRDHAVELGALVAEAFLASAEGTKVLSGLGDDVIVEGEIDSAGLVCARSVCLKYDRDVRRFKQAVQGRSSQRMHKGCAHL